MSVSNKEIYGDVSVNGDVSTGGNADVQGSLRVGHNLKVEGWLEADNIKDVNKGLFIAKEELEEAYPLPRNGWFAGVLAQEEELTEMGIEPEEGIGYFIIHVGIGQEWRSTDKLYTVKVDIASIENLQERIVSLGEDVLEISHAVEVVEDKAPTDVDYADIDHLMAISEDASSLKARLYKVLVSGKCVGWMLTDGCQENNSVGQTFFTFLSENDGELHLESHLDGAYNIYRRIYNISRSSIVVEATGESVAQGTWSKWHSIAGDGIYSEIATVRNSLAETNVGVANLSEAFNDYAEQVTNKMPELIDVLELGGMVEGVTLTGGMSAVADTGDVVFDTQTHRMYYREAGPIPRYYRYWPDREAWCDDDGTPLPGKLYIDTTRNVSYRWDGTDLVEVGRSERVVCLTEAAYDALEPDDNIIYMIYEDD